MNLLEFLKNQLSTPWIEGKIKEAFFEILNFFWTDAIDATL